MLSISAKQNEAVLAVKDSQYKQILLIGALGTSKTFIGAVIMLSLAKQYQGSHLAVARKHMPELKRSTYLSFMEAADSMGITYTENRADMFWMIGTSRISFIELNPTRDPQMGRVKSVNLTAAFIDEADTLTDLGYTMLFSRTGRNNKNGAPDFVLSACNPNQGYLKSLFYDPWKTGTLPVDMKVVEFTTSDSFLDESYYAKFGGMPLQWRRRYLENQWNYQDDTDSLFKYRYFDAALVSDLDLNAKRYTGYDVARSGSDRSVVALWYGKTLVDIQVVKDKDEQMQTDDQAMWLIKYITQNAVLPENTSIDAVGVGGGVIDVMRSRGLMVKEFISGGTPSSDLYDKLRSEVIYMFARGLETGEIKIYEGCPFRNELISEAMAHNHKTTDRKLAVESKDEIKKRTGSLSPDIFDAVVMGLQSQTHSINARDHIIF